MAQDSRRRSGTPWQWRLGKVLDGYGIFIAVFGVIILLIGIVGVIVDST